MAEMADTAYLNDMQLAMAMSVSVSEAAAKEEAAAKAKAAAASRKPENTSDCEEQDIVEIQPEYNTRSKSTATPRKVAALPVERKRKKMPTTKHGGKKAPKAQGKAQKKRRKKKKKKKEKKARKLKSTDASNSEGGSSSGSETSSSEDSSDDSDADGSLSGMKLIANPKWKINNVVMKKEGIDAMRSSPPHSDHWNNGRLLNQATSMEAVGHSAQQSTYENYELTTAHDSFGGHFENQLLSALNTIHSGEEIKLFVVSRLSAAKSQSNPNASTKFWSKMTGNAGRGLSGLSETAYAASQGGSSRGATKRAKSVAPTKFAKAAGIMPQRVHGFWYYKPGFGADGGSWQLKNCGTAVCPHTLSDIVFAVDMAKERPDNMPGRADFVLKRIYAPLRGFDASCVSIDVWVRSVLVSNIDAQEFLRLPKTAIVVHILKDGHGEHDSVVQYVLISNEARTIDVYTFDTAGEASWD